MAEGDLAEALRRLMERGWRTGDPTRGDMAGLRDLVDRLERRREQMLERYQLNDVLGDIRRELEEIVAEERAGVERRLDEASRTDGGETPDDLRSMLRDVSARRLDQLDGLPPDVGERIRGLQDYDFLEPNARERFDELVKRLQGQVLDQFVEGMSEAIRTMSPEDLAANREMVRDLNELIRERIGGGDPDATEFLAKHGQFFPGARTFDDIIDQLAQRMAAMQSLMRSMSPQQRAELQSMMEALLRDDRILVDLAQLASNLDLLLPGGLGDRVPFGGDEPLGLDGALAQITRLQAMDQLADALSDVESPADLAAIDRDEVRDLLGDEAALRARCARRPRSPARGGRLPHPRRGAAGTDPARQPQDRPEGPRRPVRTAPARRVRRSPHRSRRPGRGARRGDQAVRVRRPVPPRPARHAVQRPRPRGERIRRRARRAAIGGSTSLRPTSRSTGPRC